VRHLKFRPWDTLFPHFRAEEFEVPEFVDGRPSVDKRAENATNPCLPTIFLKNRRIDLRIDFSTKKLAFSRGSAAVSARLQNTRQTAQI